MGFELCSVWYCFVLVGEVKRTDMEEQGDGWDCVRGMEFTKNQ